MQCMSIWVYLLRCLCLLIWCDRGTDFGDMYTYVNVTCYFNTQRAHTNYLQVVKSQIVQQNHMMLNSHSEHIHGTHRNVLFTQSANIIIHFGCWAMSKTKWIMYDFEHVARPVAWCFDATEPNDNIILYELQHFVRIAYNTNWRSVSCEHCTAA